MLAIETYLGWTGKSTISQNPISLWLQITHKNLNQFNIQRNDHLLFYKDTSSFKQEKYKLVNKIHIKKKHFPQ